MAMMTITNSAEGVSAELAPREEKFVANAIAELQDVQSGELACEDNADAIIVLTYVLGRLRKRSA